MIDLSSLKGLDFGGGDTPGTAIDLTPLKGLDTGESTTAPSPITKSLPVNQLPASYQQGIKNSGTISAPKPESLWQHIGDIQQSIASFFGNDNNTKIQDKYQTLADAGVNPMQATNLAAKHILDPSKITPDDLKGMTKPQIVALASSFDQASLDRAMNTPVGKVLNFTKKVVLEAPARGGMKIALSSAFNPLGDTYNPDTPLDKFLYGDQPIKSIGSTFADRQKAVAGAFGDDKKTGAVVGTGVAAIGAVGESILDFLPVWAGGEEALAKDLLTAKTAEEATAVLTKTGLSEDLITAYAPKFAEAGTKAEVQTGLDSLKNVLETTAKTGEGNLVYHGTKGGVTDISKLDSLNYGDPQALYGPGTYVTDSKDIAEGYSKTKNSPIDDILKKPETGNVLVGRINPGTKLLNLEKPLSSEEAKIFNGYINKNYGDFYDSEVVTNHDATGMTGKDAFNMIKENLAESQIQKYEGHEILTDLQYDLKTKLGYDGYAHIGGVKAGTPHNVSILFNTGEQDFKLPITNIEQPAVEGAAQVPPNVPPGEAPSPLPSDNLTPQEKLIQSINDAKPLRDTQEASYSAERGSRIGAFANIGKNTSGEQGFYQQLGALKGELTKVDFPSIRPNFSQPEIDTLFDQVKSSDLTNFEKATAGNQLSLMLGKEGGILPTEKGIDLLTHIFGQDFTSAVEQMTEGNKSILQRALDFSANVLQLPKTMVSTMNLHFPFNQGLFLAPSMPKEYGQAWLTEWKSLISEGNHEEIQAMIEKNPWFDRATETGMSVVNLGKNMSKRPEEFMSTLLDKIPGVRATGRATMDAGNVMRMNAWVSLAEKAEALGRDPMNDEKLAQSISDFVNTATNRGKAKLYGTGLNLENQAVALNAVFFSPRKTFSTLNLMNPAYYASLDPFVRQQALKSLLAHAGATVTILTLASMAGAEVGLDPRSADFGKIKIGDTRIDISSSEQQYVRMAAQLITGQYISTTTDKLTQLGVGYKPMTRLDILTRQIQSKESPVAAFVTDLLKGQQYNGQPLDFNPDITDENSEMVQRLTPFVYQDLLAIAKSDPNLLPLGAISFFGGMTETYGPAKAASPYGYGEKRPASGGGSSGTSTGGSNIDLSNLKGLGL